MANTDFDPDAYLNTVPQATGAFDPDKYLAAPATGPKPNPDMLPQPAGDDVRPLPAGATESDRRRRDIAALATQQPYRNSVFGTAGALTPEEAQAERAKRIAEAQDTSAAATEERRRLAAQQATADAMGPANIKRGRANYSPNPVPSAIKEEEAAEAAAKTARDAPLPTMTAGRQAADRFTSSVLDGVRTGVRGMIELAGASNSLDHVGKVGAGRTEQSALDRASEATKNWIAEAFPADKAREKDFWTSQLPQGAGSSVPFLVAGLAARAVGAGDSVMTGIMAATGAGQQAGSEVEAFDEAIKKRRSVLDGLLKAKTPDEFRDQFFEEKDALRKALGPEEYNRVARVVAGHDPVAMQQVMQQLQVTRAGLDSVALKRMAVLFANAGIGTTEALPISNALERMNALSGGAVARIAKAGAANSFEEFVQEVGQQLGQNFVQGVVYDKAQDIYEGAADAGKVAAMIGLFQGGGMQAFHEAMNIGRSSGSLPLPGTVPPLLNPQDQANELRDILGEPRVEPPAPSGAAYLDRPVQSEGEQKTYSYRDDDGRLSRVGENGKKQWLVENDAGERRWVDENRVSQKVDYANFPERRHAESWVREVETDAPVTAAADSRSILSEDPESRRPDDTDVRPDQESYVGEAMRNLRATSRTAKGVLDLSSTPGKEDQMTGVSAKHAATLAQENFEGVIRNIYDRLDEMPQDGPSMAAFIDSTAEAVNQGIVKPGRIMREHDTKIPVQTAALDLPAAHAQFSQELAERLADPNADPVETAAWIEWRANTIDHFWSDGVGKTSKALAAIPLMRAGLPLPNYPSSKEFFSYSPTDRVDLNGGGEAYLGPAWDRFNAFYHTLVGKPESQQRAELKSMLENPATPLNDIITHPMVRRARDINQAAASTGTPENFADPAWRQARVYDFGGERVQGWDEAVERLTDQAKSFSTAEPVEQGNHAVIVLGPPAAGKSSISEPLARALRAAIVDADEAKKVIPEYRNGLGSHASHEESSELAKGVFKNLARNGSNIILPKVGHSYESIKGLVDVLKSLGYRVDIAHVAATPEISHRRNIARFLETGRLVDPDHITSVGDKPRNTAYMLKGDANDFIDADTSKGFEIVDGSGPLADAIRARRNVGWSPDKGRAGNLEGTGRGAQPDLIGEPVPGMQVHRVTDADGRSVEVAPVVVEAGSLRTSRDYGYDQELQPRDRDRAASDAQIREIENKLDPERLGYSSEADRGSPIVGSDRMVESGNGRVIALRNLYDKKRPQANAYRDWLRRQGVNVDAYQHPVLVRQRLTALTPKERQDFTLAANRPATLAMSAPEVAVSDARHMNARMLGLIKNPDDLGSPANIAFFRSFLSLLPKSEHGTLADSKGHLSSVGMTRARNAILAKAYGDSDVLARIAESTNDDVKSISNALTAAAPAWAAMRADVEAGHVRADMDITPALVRAVEQTAEIRSRGEKLDTFLAQQDAFDRLPAEVEGFMRMFYDPQGRRAASARRITDALRFVANEASKVSAEKSLGLDLIPVEPQDIQRLAREREWQDVEQGLSEPGRSPGDGARDEASGRQARGPWLSPRGEVAAQRGDEVDPVEEAIRAQRPTLEELRGPARVTEKTRAGDQFVFPGGERISSAELARRRAAEPLKPRAVQKATDFGLFGETAPQGDLLAVAPLKAANVAPTITAEETGDGRTGIQPSAPQVPGRTQARRLAKTPASRPQELPLFGWQPSGGQVRDADVPVRPEPGGQEPPVHGEGPSVTKPPTRGGRNRPRRTDLPAVKGRLEAEKKIAERSRSNYRITPEDQVGVGNARQKINGNIAAIRTLKAIQEENRFATPEEKAILVRYVGWGAFAQDMFATHKPEWKNERDAFRALVSDDEYNSARESTLNAHFTSPDVIRGMWDAMAHLGFKGGQAIEPAAGVGHFIGLIPDKVASKTAWTAVELDPLTGGIAKALYAGSDVAIHGFEDLRRPSNYYDLAISNVPFGQYHVSEKPYGSFPIHDFFFVKSLDKVRPGGVVAFITSRYTMDRVDPETRRLLGQSADLVGAIRLPGGRKGAFAGNAGTEVTTDIIFLRKKVPGEPAFPGANWSELKEIKTPEGPVQINEYFADRPEMMLGEMRLQGSMYQANEPVLVGDPEGIQQRIAAAARKMPEGALLPMESPPPPPISANEIGAGIKDGSFFLQNGNLYQRRQGQGFENPVNPEDHDRLARLIGMRGIINDLLQTQLDAGENAKARSDQLRGELRRAYDAFVDAHGPINKEIRTVTSRLDKEGEPVVIVRHPNLTLFRKDPDAWKVAAIEDYDSETGKTKRAAIQTKDVIDPPKERQINGPSDALSASLNDTAGVDLDHIAQSLNLDSHDAVVEALGNLVFQNPNGRKWETADEYLSGNVVKKLEDARVLAETDPTYLRNVSALEKVQPEPLTGTDITAQFGAPWIPGEVYQDFLKEIGIHNPRVAQVPITGEWKFDYAYASNDAQVKYGTSRVDVGKIANAAINNKMVTVYDRIGEDKPVVNETATQEARVKTELLKEAFTGDLEHGIDGWVFADPDRAQLLEGIYNRTYNNLAQRQFDGSHLTLPGLNPDFSTRKHRRDAIWRIIQSGNTLLAHVVGSGKAQPLDAKILTPAGWREMGSIKTGDVVIAGDGSPACVTGVFPQGEKDIYRVVFSDGASTECCDEHLWFTKTYRERGYAQRGKKLGKSWQCGAGDVRPLSEIRSTLIADHLGAKNHSIPMVGAVQFRSRPVPLDPYLVGVLIGDGCLTGRLVRFTSADEYIVQAIRDVIPDECEVVHSGGYYEYRIAYRGLIARVVGGRGAAPSHTVKNALIQTGLFGKYSYEKRVPPIYLHNDIGTRIAVLRGLMDTDGTVDKRGVGTTFTTTSPGLADDVTELVCSLGGVATRSTRIPFGGREATTLQIAMPPEINPFNLPRKADLVRPKSRYAPTRYIVDVAPVGRKLAQCIAVDHPSHLYVTDNYIVTHNTVTMIGAAMEEKRLGLINKPAMVVPNHMLEQFSREFLQAYPNAKILVAQKDEMTREHRKEFLAKVAANDWDGIIITHDAFGRINMGHDFRREFIQDQLDELERVMRAESAGDKKSPTVKNLEKVKKKLKERLQNLMNEERKDEGTSFEESGIDRLYIDEAHKFKNLQFITRQQNIAGLAQGNSQRAEDLFLKIRYLEQKRPARSAVFATGTPVSNTMAELWTMMRYLELDKLRERGLETFDAWASTFGRVVNNMELSADGRTFKEKASFSKFVNIPELIALYSEVADTKTADMLNLPRPEVKTRSGAPGIEIVEATPSSQEEEYIDSLVKLAESLKGKPPRKGEPNMLSVVTAGRKVATDGRLISSDFDFNPRGKIALAVGNIARIYQEGNEDPAAPNKVQMVFLDMGVPQSRGAKRAKSPTEGEIKTAEMMASDLGGTADDYLLTPTPQDRIDLYADLKQRLADQGIPAREIAAIHDASDDIKKAKLFKRVRSGEIRVILGSSEKMGVGTNVQDLLIAMHHLDAPWKPAEVEQRDGRIVRQGNHNKTVQIYRYVTKKSFDAFMWQKLDTKARFIGQVLSGAKGSRHAEDIDNPLPEAAEMKAAASGDPRIMEHAELDRIVRSLSAQRRAFDSTKSRANSGAAQAKSRIEMYEKALPNAKADAAAVQDISGDKFSVELGDAGTFTNRAEAGKAILEQLAGINAQSFYKPKVFMVGSMSGLTMNMDVRGGWDGTQTVVRATPSLKGKSGYGAAYDTVINEYTDPAGLIRRFENILANIRTNPERLTRELTNEKESLGKLQRTLSGEWPREKEYREALKKLDDMTKAMKAPEHPDVVEAHNDEVKAQVPDARKEFLTFKDKPAWAVVVDPIDNAILHSVRYKHAAENHFNHSQYMPERFARMVSDGDAILAWADDRGVHAMEPLSPQMQEAVERLYYGGPERALFGGSRSLTADHGRRAQAEQMSAAGASREEVFKKTGWYKDVDGNWKFYISDEHTKLKSDVLLIADLPEALAAVIDAPALFAAYPHLRDVRVVRQDLKGEKGGHWDTLNNTIAVDTKLDQKQTLSAIIHEVQHAIQGYEGFAPGSSPDTIGVGKDRYMRSAGEVEARNAEFWARIAQRGLVGRLIVTRNDALVRLDEAQKANAPKSVIARLKKELKQASEQQQSMGSVGGVNYVGSEKFAEELKTARKSGASKDDLQRMVDKYQKTKLTREIYPWETRDTLPSDILLPPYAEEMHNAEERQVTPKEIKARFKFEHREPLIYHEAVSLLYSANGSKKRLLDWIDADLAKSDMRPFDRAQKTKLREYVEGAVAPDQGLVSSVFRVPRDMDPPIPGDLGPQPGETVVKIGRGTVAHIKPTDRYTKAEQKIAAAVQEIGNRMAPQADVQGTAALRMRGEQIWGAFVNSKAFPHLIAWSLEKGSAGQVAQTVRHEIVHHLREAGLIRPDEWAALHDAAVKGGWIGKHDIDVRYPHLSRDRKVEEAIAEEFSYWRTDRAVIRGFKDPVKRLIMGAFNRIDLLLRRIAAAARKFLGRDATVSDIFTRMETGEVGRREKAGEGRGEKATVDTTYDIRSGAVASKDPNGPVFIDRRIPQFSPTLKARDGGPAHLWKYLAIHETEERAAMAKGMPYEKAHETVATPAERTAVEDDGVDWKAYTREMDGYLAAIEHEPVKNPPPNPHVDPNVAVGKPHHHSANKPVLDDDIRAQTPGREARERRQAAAVPARTIWQRVVQSSDNFRAAADAYADSIGVNEIIRGLQMKAVPMAARDASVEARVITKEYMNWYRQSRHDWNNVDKRIMDNFPADRRRAMWEAADEQSVAMQQGLPTAGIGLDRLPANERAVVDMLQNRGASNFAEARSLKMIQTAGLPSYAPRMLVRMSNGEAEIGAGAGSEIVKDIRTLALANARLEQAIAARKMINAIEDVGRRSGTATVNSGGAPSNRVGADGVVAHALDQMGVGFATTTPQLRHRKHLTAAETEAAANLVRTPPPDAPKWFTLNNPAFMRLEPRLVVNATTGKFEIVKDPNGDPVFDRKPIYVRSDFEGPLRAVLSKDSDKLYQFLMALKGKAMSVIMMSPLIHNQVEWGRALPAAPGKVLSFQVYLEGNRVANDPARMRLAISGGTSPIGGHGFMQDLVSIAEAPTLRPGSSITAKGLGYAAEATGHISRLFNPRAGADQVRNAVDYFGKFWHNTLLWDRIRDLQMGLWSHIYEDRVRKGTNPYAANVAASHFANRYAGALPLESMSGSARGIANLLLFSRTFTLGNLGAFKDAFLGLPRDAQALVQHHAGWDELQKIQSFVRRKSWAMLAIDAGLYYATLSALQSAFNVAGVVPSVATLGGMIAGGALGGRFGKYGGLATAVAGGAVGFGLAAVLGASPGTKKLEDELEGYWERFADLMHRLVEHPFNVVTHPIMLLESLSSTSENEPGKKGRILVGYQPDGTAIYARLAVGKVTEELIGWVSSANEMLHNKLSTFARPLNEIWSNDVGFGHKLYNPKAETYTEQAKNAIKIGAAIVGSQIPLDTIKGAIEWAQGGPGSDVAGLKAIAPFIGTTISKGYPGGPELGVINAAKEQQRYRQNEWMPTIRKQILNGEIDKATEKMTELGISPELQRYYITTTQNPKARLNKRQMQDFMRYATPEQRKEFEAAQRRGASETRSTGGAVAARASGGAVLARANGGQVDASNINHSPSPAQASAGNYRHDHIRVQGLDITVENAKGSIRRGVGSDGKPWACRLSMAYGYIKKTTGADSDHLDVFVGPHIKSPRVYVIDQIDPHTGKWDEHKAIIGLGSEKQAREFYARCFSDGKGHARIGRIHEMAMERFKSWLDGGDTTKPFSHIIPESEKREHASVGYVAESKVQGSHCSNCMHYVHGAPPSCEGVKRPIAPVGYCRRYVRG